VEGAGAKAGGATSNPRKRAKLPARAVKAVKVRIPLVPQELVVVEAVVVVDCLMAPHK